MATQNTLTYDVFLDSINQIGMEQTVAIIQNSGIPFTCDVVMSNKKVCSRPLIPNPCIGVACQISSHRPKVKELRLYFEDKVFNLKHNAT